MLRKKKNDEQAVDISKGKQKRIQIDKNKG